jgi:dihydropteroate synthase
VGVPSEWLDPRCRDNGAALMGVLNVTPDSFYDGGRYLDPPAARERVDRLLAEGASIIDIGAESSRPGAAAVTAAEQLDRIDASLRHAVARGSVVSVDTTSPEVAERALAAGARMINDVSCLADADLARVTARGQGTLLLMHARGHSSTQAGFSMYPEHGYADVVGEVRDEWRRARERAMSAGLAKADVWFDPGLGFMKNARQSFELLARLDELSDEGVPIVVGPSRKSFIAAVDGSAPDERLGGTIAACLCAVERGARVLRVHDVQATRQALAVARLARRVPVELGAPHA